MRVELDEAFDRAEIRRLLLAARLFLESKFVDLRTPDQAAAGVPMSAGNCWVAARFASSVLKAERVSGSYCGDDGSGSWAAAFGWCLDRRGEDRAHCFAVWDDRSTGETAIVDLTADQFGHDPILFAPPGERYAIKNEIASNPQGKTEATKWFRAWTKERASWLALADERLAVSTDAPRLRA